MSEFDVFPPSNLPGLATEWGRAVENRIVGGESARVQLEQKTDNGLRATEGQLAVLSQQVNEFAERQNQVNALSTSRTFNGNTSGDASFFWSPFEFTITKPRGMVLDTWLFASITIATGDAGSLATIVGYEPVEGSYTILPVTYGVSESLTRTTAGTSFGNVRGRVYLRLGAGTYKLWSGVILTTTNISSSVELTQGVSTLTIGQQLSDTSILDLDLP